MDRINKGKIIVNSIKTLTDWLISPEGIFILVSGGYERTFRDKLIFQIQTNLKKKGIAVSEKVLREKRPDILIIENFIDWKIINTVIEIKINSINQIKEISGKNLAEIKQEIKTIGMISPNNSDSRFIRDFNRWASSENHKPIYFIYLIVNVKNVEKPFDKFFNYKSSLKDRPYSYQDIENYFKGICKGYNNAHIELLYKKKLSQKMSNPFRIALDIHLNIFEMTDK